MAAGLGFKTFTTGEVLTAADTNGYLMQGILVFASAAARDSAITSPQEGQACYLKDTDSVLTYSGSAWVAVGGASGGMTLINSGGTTLTGASITISSIPGTYKNLQLIVRNFRPTTDAQALGLRFNSDSGANRHFTNESFGKPAAIAFNDTAIYCSEGSDNTTAQGIITIDIPDYANATTWKFMTSFGITNDATTSTNARSNMTTGGYNQTDAITAITLFSSSGNLTSGTAFLYGVS
jgi:hypothetical protein